jgi:hypothetical protein
MFKREGCRATATIRGVSIMESLLIEIEHQKRGRLSLANQSFTFVLGLIPCMHAYKLLKARRLTVADIPAISR